MIQLHREDQALCTELCVAPYNIPTGSIPNTTELKELKEHITNLLEVKEQRLKEFHKLRREVRLHSKEIGHISDGTLENNMLCDDEEKYICLTEKYLEDLQLLIHQVGLFWEKELRTLEELKKEKLKEISLKVRQELESYWQKCFYTNEQKGAFQPFYDGLDLRRIPLILWDVSCPVCFLIYIENFSEELLSHHDEELFKIKVLYEEAKCVYDSIHKWEAILDSFIELQKKSTDPSRLLNRGGNLLKEKRERSKIQKQLLKVKCQDNVFIASLICVCMCVENRGNSGRLAIVNLSK
ncbi:hypothetical protein Chor_007325 [Crotalus horridus]